ncbi:hypothetical protein [Streptomyces katrae]|uniref:Uncharacterized protein n=1 Tax=Streptomyces katrae TaxID=68223 RepID=A0A0F4JZ69_9ACTN|nr:hypothetical protein [Streptomyces katrae]KJY39003.1 hypothetical protein VR44_02515 [Streptomyces katrae]
MERGRDVHDAGNGACDAHEYVGQCRVGHVALHRYSTVVDVYVYVYVHDRRAGRADRFPAGG